MRAKLVIALALLLAGVTAGTAVFGPDILSEQQEDATDIESFPTATTTQDAGSGGSDGGSGGDSSVDDGNAGGDGTTTDDGSGDATTTPFTFTIVSIEECGETCRDVTIELANQQETAAENVTVYSRIFAGQGTDGDEIWTGKEAVGRLAAGESVTATKRVSLSFSEAFAVQQADGWITIQTTVQSENETMTFTEQRDVA